MNIFGYDISFARSRTGNAPITTDPNGQKTVVIDTDSGPMPVSGGRTSVPEGASTLAGFISEELSLITPDYQVELLRVLEHLAIYNPDVSYALDNIVQLGNTAFDVFFDGEGLTDDQILEMRQNLTSHEDRWYSHSGGLNSLRNDLLAQIALTGALSAEMVPDNSLQGIKKIVLVNPCTIRFSYNLQDDIYEPFQEGSAVVAKTGQSVVGMNRLNPNTYKYMAIRRFNENPYGIPPFLSALEAVAFEKYLLENYRHIIKKVGIMGFLSVVVNQPQKKPGQNDAQYQAEAQTYLNEVAKETEKGVAKGFVVGYKGSHDFDMKQVTQNTTGAQQIFKMNTEMKTAGLKQDPLMLGKNYSTTETIGRVILAKLSAQLQNYQGLMDKYLAEVFFVHLKLAGFDRLSKVTVESKKPLIGDELREQQAMREKVANFDSLYKQGIIGQSERAQALGYDEPDQEEPREPVVPNNAPTPNPDSPASDDPTGEKTTGYASGRVYAEISLGAHHPIFDYGQDDVCGCADHSHHHGLLALAGNDDDYNGFLREYAARLGKEYSAAVKAITNKVLISLQALEDGATLESVTDAMFYQLYVHWKVTFTDRQKDYVESFINKAYRFFRSSKAPFGGIKPPEVVFDLRDIRALEFYAKSDILYLGKFVTDPDTKRKLTEFIKEKFVAGELPTGRDAKLFAQFKSQFEELMQLEDWKIARIINTTVNRVRNAAALNYMAQAGIEKYERIELNDRLTCPYCKSVAGRQFSVTVSLSKLDSVMALEPQYIGTVAPFLTAIGKADSLAGKSDEQLEDYTLMAGPLHPNCRGSIAAVQ
ncbi:hypothetical protein UFOVP1492_28 [uncultured Caudovirales phage]|uniref:Uncharacterized protein n=1 Tax=uncultured Caudovirales phage TaxID=2100421 RepID=A0A6J5QY35_9CAUD|nr:hypothetical protein UFOVP1127_106 [uncultured Caudovirales phage]CAB4193564.1 hypothetical protein UFOVP1242_104 [uncultured Caudovirales phage]CAB4217417.1 hypothetical protein UFOVP1492_28 [uncultured Caudovirales phage]CAB5231314.1 hypothetical protein UFOVP1580_57 [uncultured Caudovirales phage]